MIVFTVTPHSLKVGDKVYLIAQVHLQVDR